MPKPRTSPVHLMPVSSRPGYCRSYRNCFKNTGCGIPWRFYRGYRGYRLYRALAVILFSLLLSLPVKALCASNRADRIDAGIAKAAPLLKKYSQAPAVEIAQIVDIVVKEDYTVSYHVVNTRKILNSEGKKRCSDIRLRCNQRYSQIVSGDCFTIDRAGKRLHVPADKIKNMPAANNREIRDNPEGSFRDTLIHFPGVEAGCYTVLEYTYTDKRGIPVNDFENARTFIPLLYKRVSLTFPGNYRLNTYCDKSKWSFIRRTAGKNKIYTWETKDSPALVEENNSPPFLVNCQPILFSFYRDWQDMGRRNLSPLFAYTSPGSTAIKRIAAEVSAAVNTDRQKLIAIYRYIYTNFRYRDANIRRLDFKPIPLARLLEQKWGTQRDMTALFIALARSAGVEEVYPAFVLGDYYLFPGFDAKIVLHDFLDRVCVFWQGLLIAPGSGDIPFGFCCDHALVVVGNSAGNYPLIDFQYSNQYTREKNYHYILRGDGADVRITEVRRGHSDWDYRRRFYNKPPAEQAKRMKDLLGQPDAELYQGPSFPNIEHIDEDMVVEYNVKYRDVLVDYPPHCYFKLPEAGPLVEVPVVERKNDYQVYTRQYVHENFVITLDKAVDFLNPMQKMRFSSPVGKSEAYFLITSRLEAGKIYFSREFFIPEGLIKRADYPAFRKFILDVKDTMNHTIFLEK